MQNGIKSSNGDTPVEEQQAVATLIKPGCNTLKAIVLAVA